MVKFEKLSVTGRLNAVSGHVDKGDFVHVLGTNGAGKSSLLSAIAGLLELDSGLVLLNGLSIVDYSLPQLASFRCFQEQQQSSAFALTVSEVLYFFSECYDLPDDLEDALELTNLMHKPLNQLSGGEARRVHIARTLLQVWPAIKLGQAIILLDEPTQGLDFKHQHLLFSLLARLSDSGSAVVVNHHDLNLCQQYANKIWLLQQGQIVKTMGSLQSISNDDLSHIFSCGIRFAIDEAGNKIFQTYLE
ncbi:MAG: ATP-binding cassette domain-containing protein [Paraglaciecola sp.]|nr:ATP-binding cassette domain-containing protein [Paraglaciecola sp.]